MTKVVVSGGAGQMGRLVARAVDAAANLELAGRYDPRGTDGTIADRAGLAGAEVVVEFCPPDVVMDNLEAWRGLGLHAVVGTSGFTEERISAVRGLFGGGPPNCLIVPNFAVGAVLAMRFAEQAARHFDAAEIIELHHDNKADAPSGTAIATAGRIGAAGSQKRAVDSKELVTGARGGFVDEVPIHSVRLPGLLAHQEVILGRPGETLTIRHDTTDRAAFLPGVLIAIRKVSALTGVTVGLDAVLDA